MADRATIISRVSAKAGEYSGATGWACRQWGQKFLHTCESYGLTAAVRLLSFAACMEGDDLRWFEVKENLDDLLEALFEAFSATGPTFQRELEREYERLQQSNGQSVNEYGRDFSLVIGLMEDPPSLPKQLVRFKKGFLHQKQTRNKR